jgi:F0F1-type ATP synthase delta subunit
MENNFGGFEEKISTTSDLNTLLSDISEAESASYSAGPNVLTRKLKGKISPIFEAILRKLEKEGTIPESQEGRVSYFQKLRDYLQNLPKVRLELAFKPNGSFIRKMATFIRSDSRKTVVLDIEVKPAILAGATIEHNGNYKDYSYSGKLEQLLKEKYSGGLDASIR